MSLHATFNIMLYEAENDYLQQCSTSRQQMAIMIDMLHAHYGNMSVWQQNLLRHLFWAIFTADAGSHNMQMQEHVLCAPYMHVHKQRPSEQCMQMVERLKRGIHLFPLSTCRKHSSNLERMLQHQCSFYRWCSSQITRR